MQKKLGDLYVGHIMRGCGLGLETYQRLVSVSSREKLSTSRSRLVYSRLGLELLRLVPIPACTAMVPVLCIKFPGGHADGAVRSVNGL